MSSPKVIQDPVLGCLEPVQGLGIWEGSVTTSAGDVVALSLSCDSPNEFLPQLIQAARGFLAFVESNTQAPREAVADELLQEYNEEYRLGDKSEMTREQFINQLRLAAILVSETEGDAECQVTFDTDVMFWDRQPEVVLDREMKVVRVSLN